MYIYKFILPEILLLVFSIYLILYSVFSKKFFLNININLYRIISFLYLFLFLYSFLISIELFFCGNFSIFFYCYIIDFYSFFCKSIVFLSYFIFILIIRYQTRLLTFGISKEFFFFLSISLLFVCFSISSFNIFFLFLSLEGLTLISIIMVSIFGSNTLILESVINYFFISAISSVFFILGIYLISIYLKIPLYYYNFKQNFCFSLNFDNYNINFYNFLLIFGVLLIIFFFLIKIGLFPFFFWIPKFYNSVWFPFFFYLIVVKFVFIFSFFRFVTMVIPENIIFSTIFYIISLGSIVVGCLGALCSNNIKYFISFTSINNLGFVFMGFSTLNFYTQFYSFLFLIIYFFNFIIFFISILFIKKYSNVNFNIIKDDVSFNRFSNLVKFNNNQFLNFILLISFFSISNLPPFASFFIKINLLSSVWEYGNCFMVIVALLCSFISIFYYFKLVKLLFLNK